jgi:cell division protein FtsQ
MPLSQNYIYYTTVVTNVPELKNDSASWGLRQQIVKLVSVIQSDTFWSAQISQVIVDSAGSFTLMPVLGDHKILFGDTSRIQDKFSNLFEFYKDVLNRIGWDKYETLDVRFSGQVIASPSLPYTGPVDKAIDKMNWVNSIVETEAKNAENDSAHVAPVNVRHLPPAKAAPKHVGKNVAKAKTVIKSNAQRKKDEKKRNDKHNKQKPNSNNNKKKATPKYVYPDKKKH